MIRIILAFAVASFSACGPVEDPGATDDPSAFREDLLLVQPGDLPILLVAPHGGRPNQSIPGVPRRTGRSFLSAESALRTGRWGGFVRRRDAGTERVTVQVSESLELDLGRRPYVVMARFNRAYVDPNRPPQDAFEHPLAEPYYHAYHEAIERFVHEIQERWGRGILLDIHGGATPDEIHFGTRDGRTMANVRAIYGAAALEGPNSIYGRLRASGYAVYPPPGEPEYLAGGYTGDTYGTMAGVDAIQLEITSGRRRSDKRTVDLTADLADALRAFHDAFLPSVDR